MERLLKWAIVNSATENEDATQSSRPQRTLAELDPGVIDAILGKDDASIMRELMDRLEDPTVDIDDKEQTFEDFEMLVGQIDNAINMEPLQMWPRLMAMLDSDAPEMRRGAAWIAGTCVQNNPIVKVKFVELEGLGRMLHCLAQDTSMNVRAKALYCLSSLLQNAPPIIELFAASKGYATLLSVLQRSEDERLWCKTLFLLNQLAIQCPDQHLPVVHKYREYIPAIVAILDSKIDDEDIVEKALQMLVSNFAGSDTKATCRLTEQEVQSIQQLVPELQTRYGGSLLSTDEWQLLNSWTSSHTN